MLISDVMLADQKRLIKIEKTVKKNKVFNSKYKQITNKVQTGDKDEENVNSVKKVQSEPPTKTEVQTKSFQKKSFIFEDHLGHTTKGPGRRGSSRR